VRSFFILARRNKLLTTGITASILVYGGILMLLIAGIVLIVSGVIGLIFQIQNIREDSKTTAK
jgi:hypothetical protein